MTQWTNSARALLDDYLARAGQSAQASGADPAEVVDDLRCRVEEEVAAQPLQVVTEQDMHTILARLGPPEPPAGPVTPQSNRFNKDARSPLHFGLLFFAVILPVVTLGIELATHMCAGVFFDPIPTWWHVALVATVPVINAFSWQALRERKVSWLTTLGWANAFALGISAFYALLYLPLIPLAFIAIIFLGWGLLPLSPLFSMIAGLRLRRLLRAQAADRSPLPGFWRGIGIATVTLLIVAVPSTATRYIAHFSNGDSAQTRTAAIKWLRAIGSERQLLADCYGSTSWSRNSPFGVNLVGTPLPTEEARTVYFRVTGRPFNSVPPPQQNYARGGWDLLDDWTWDPERGGEAVAGRVKGLTLSQSRLDGLFDPNAAWSYTEWIMEFKNSGAAPQEARAQLSLPPGGCVSRLTLWVNGEEREAAFAGTPQVREAYKQVAVVQRRDPVLVTSCGLDRILMQCFPVPANGGLMKIRVGITAPASSASSNQAALVLPSFLERNFTIPSDLKHSVWVESRQPLSSPNPALNKEQTHPGKTGMRGEIDDKDLGSPRSAVFAPRNTDCERSWVTDHTSKDGGLVWQTVQMAEASKPDRIIFVLDGSKGMENVYEEVAEMLVRLPPLTEIAVVHAGDEVQTSGIYPANSHSMPRLSAFIRQLPVTGGQDNIEALVRGWDLSGTRTNTALVWIHGPQPALFGNIEALKQRLDWRTASSAGPRIFDLQTRPGPNRLLEKIDATAPVDPIVRLGSLKDDLERTFSIWRGEQKALVFVRERALSTNMIVGSLGTQSSKHLARLWAYGEILKKIRAHRVSEAMALAARYQLVTPVSGAVVLESAAQFARAGLAPVDPASVPTVPEPSTIALICGAVGMLVILQFRQKLRRKRDQPNDSFE